MSQIHLNKISNLVKVTETPTSVEVQRSSSQIVEVIAPGPQGPEGVAGTGFDIDTTGKVDKSLVYFNSAAGKFIADDTWTTDTLVLGGNF